VDDFHDVDETKVDLAYRVTVVIEDSNETRRPWSPQNQLLFQLAAEALRHNIGSTVHIGTIDVPPDSDAILPMESGLTASPQALKEKQLLTAPYHEVGDDLLK